jgi:2Fe-2S ferredoxin
MPKVIFIEHDGTRHEVAAHSGLSLMRAAVDNGISGIDADCGGECACATCHVFVDPAWLERTGAQGDMERSLLGFAAESADNSRLSCQITMTDALDGITVTLPVGQH